MRDPRIEKLAKNLVHYSVGLKKGEKIMIQSTGEESEDLTKQLIFEIYKSGGIPFVKYLNERIQREILKGLSEEQVEIMAKCDSALMEEMDAYIGFRATENSSEESDIPGDKMNLYMEKYLTPVHFDLRVNHTKWVILRSPTPSMAQSACMSLESFEDFYYRVCNLDYSKLSKAMDPLVKLMTETKDVEIEGPGTKLKFSIEGIAGIKCHGDRNIPDGEVYSAPVKNSVNGTLSYNTPAVYQGVTYDSIKLKFKDGKIIDAQCNNSKRINEVFDTDEGARYIGEFALGVNPFILKPMKNALFDEKIMGSFHFTPGRCYDEASNGNDSAIHWDLVCIQTPEYGGGEIRFDGKVIRKDGKFTLPELEPLNPEHWS